MDDLNPPPFEFQQPPAADKPPSRNGRRKKRESKIGEARSVPTNKRLGRPRTKKAIPDIARGVRSKTKTATEKKAAAPDMVTALRIFARVMPEDHKPLFDITDILNEADKHARKRILAALNGIYA